MTKNRSIKIKKSTGSIVFDSINYTILVILCISCLYPFLFLVSQSFSGSSASNLATLRLIPETISLSSYRNVFSNEYIGYGFINTLKRVGIGVPLIVMAMVLTAYPLSKKYFPHRKFWTGFIVFTMFFSGGLVPGYLLVRKLGLINTRWAIVLPAGISTWNMIIMRTFFEGIPESLHEAATIDGCSDMRILFKIFLPLSLPVIAVMVLFYAVGHWNSYFSALVYINDQNLYPLQMHLRKILIQFNQNEMLDQLTEGRDVVGQSVRYATIIVSTVPILMVYPFLQKYFVKGVMVGAIKG